MKRKIHMQDQVINKVDDIMKHYNPCSKETWSIKFVVIGVFLLLGVYW